MIKQKSYPFPLCADPVVSEAMPTHLKVAFGAGPSHKAICQELAGSFTVQLLNGLLHQLPCPVQRVENALRTQTFNPRLDIAKQILVGEHP